jgi:hypothetical protein
VMRGGPVSHWGVRCASKPIGGAPAAHRQSRNGRLCGDGCGIRRNSSGRVHNGCRVRRGVPGSRRWFTSQTQRPLGEGVVAGLTRRARSPRRRRIVRHQSGLPVVLPAGGRCRRPRRPGVVERRPAQYRRTSPGEGPRGLTTVTCRTTPTGG